MNLCSQVLNVPSIQLEIRLNMLFHSFIHLFVECGVRCAMCVWCFLDISICMHVHQLNTIAICSRTIYVCLLTRTHVHTQYTRIIRRKWQRYRFNRNRSSAFDVPYPEQHMFFFLWHVYVCVRVSECWTYFYLLFEMKFSWLAKLQSIVSSHSNFLVAPVGHSVAISTVYLVPFLSNYVQHYLSTIIQLHINTYDACTCLFFLRHYSVYPTIYFHSFSCIFFQSLSFSSGKHSFIHQFTTKKIIFK